MSQQDLLHSDNPTEYAVISYSQKGSLVGKKGSSCKHQPHVFLVLTGPHVWYHWEEHFKTTFIIESFSWMKSDICFTAG